MFVKFLPAQVPLNHYKQAMKSAFPEGKALFLSD